MRTLKEIADDYYNLQAEADAWWKANVVPRLTETPTMAELNAVVAEAYLACRDADSKMRGLPGLLEVEYCFALDRVRQNENKNC